MTGVKPRRYGSVVDPKQAVLSQMYPRARRGFEKWMADLYSGEPSLLREHLADDASRLDHLDDYLREQHQIDVRPDGLIQFWEPDNATRRIVGDLPVMVYHHTSDALDDAIKKEGLVIRRNGSANPHLNSSSGVYVTTEYSGPAVEGYKNNAVRFAGGHGKTWGVRTTFGDLEPDPDDQDISSGRRQFVLPYVDPSDLIELDKPKQMHRRKPRRYALIGGSTPTVTVQVPVPTPAMPPKPKTPATPKSQPQAAPQPVPQGAAPSLPPAPMMAPPMPQPLARAFILPWMPQEQPKQMHRLPKRRLKRASP